MADNWRLSFVDACYTCVEGDPAALTSALAMLQTRIGAAMGNLLVLDSNGGLVEQLCSVGLPTGMMEDYEQHFLNLDPWPSMPEFTRLRAGAATTTTQWDLKAALVPTLFYQEFWKRWGLHHTAGAYVSLGDGALLSPALPRYHQDGAYGASADDDLKFAVKHLARAVSVMRTIRGLRATLSRHETVAQQFWCALIHLDSERRVLFANEAGMAVLQNPTLIRMRLGRVHMTARDDDEHLQYALRRMTEAPASALISEPLAATGLGGVRWLVHLAPIGNPGRRAVALFFVKADESAPTGMRALVLMGGLTSAESEVTALLLTGLSSREIAERRRTGLETVRGQVKSVMRKLNVRSGAALVQLAARWASPLR